MVNTTDERIAVIIRVFNRVEDLQRNLAIIRKCWTRAQYHVIVVFNGAAAGITLPPEVAQLCDELVVLSDNAGHMKGNAQLLWEGVGLIPSDCRYTVLLEADTWLLDDHLIIRYRDALECTGTSWASAEWVEKYWSLAVDFALARSELLCGRREQLFRFDASPERRFAELFRREGIGFLYIRELMPVHVPASLRLLRVGYGGRFRLFTRGPLVTHHIEDMAGGMREKERLTDVATGTNRYTEMPRRQLWLRRLGYAALMRLAAWAPRSSWLRRKR